MRRDSTWWRCTTRSRPWPRVDARKGQVVELRYFGGLSVDETADVLGVSPETVMRDWKFAKAWLLRELSPDAPLTREAGSQAEQRPPAVLVEHPPHIRLGRARPGPSAAARRPCARSGAR